MTFKIIHNLDSSSLSQLMADFSTGRPSAHPWWAPPPDTHAECCLHITGCKTVAQLSNPASAMLCFICVFCGLFFLFFYEPAFKNLEIAYNSYSGISWKISQSGNIVSPPHGSSDELRGMLGCPPSDKARILQRTESVTPRVSESGVVSIPFIIKFTPLPFLILMKHSSVPPPRCKVEKQKKTQRTTYVKE